MQVPDSALLGNSAISAPHGSNIPVFRFLEYGDEPEHQREWTIRELLTSPELYLEGRALRHCVFTHAPKCRRGETTIWSLRLRTGQLEKRMATIEVNPRKGEIIQTRAKANSYAGERSTQIIRRWAEAAGLHINPRSW
jgi:PcfJ-like protein